MYNDRYETYSIAIYLSLYTCYNRLDENTEYDLQNAFTSARIRAVFQNWLPMLKTYSARYINYRFLALTVNFGTQPVYIKTVWCKVRKLLRYISTHFFRCRLTFKSLLFAPPDSPQWRASSFLARCNVTHYRFVEDYIFFVVIRVATDRFQITLNITT